MLRSLKERIIQTISFEVSELIITVPIFAYFTQTSESDSLIILVVIAIAAMLWTGIHNTLFDWAELKISKRVASDRLNGMRIIHAVSHAVSFVIISIPILVLLGGLTWQEALLADLGLTVLDAAYAFIFFRVYDFVRPVTQAIPTPNLQGV